MTIRKNLSYANAFYYCTITCYKWLHLFQLTELYGHIYDWFDLLYKKRNIRICAYVIMPNHLHLVFYVHELSGAINKILSSGKRFMAYEIVKRLKKDDKKDILLLLKQGVSPKDRKRGKIHKVFEPSFDLKVLGTDKFIGQKINYIHANPVNKKWKLVDDFRKYPYSSAGFYEGSIDYRGYPVIHYKQVLD